MLSLEKLPISGARELNSRIDWRRVYQYDRDIANFHTFFEDTKAVDTFPIVLWWVWSYHDIITMTPMLATLEKNYCILILKESGQQYTQYSYRKIPDSELPLVHTDDAHSTASIIWEQVWSGKPIESPNMVKNFHNQLSDYIKQG